MPNDPQLPDVGQRLSAARLQRGLSQASVARRAGVAASYVSRLENGKIHPTFRTVMRLANALRVPLEEITGPGPVTRAQRGACPISSGGQCMLDLIRAEDEANHDDSHEVFTPRQIKLLRRFASWLRGVSPDRQRAMEILVDDLTRATTAGDPPRATRERGEATIEVISP